MDKFTKTTEIDISAMTEMEDETPKKSNVGNVIAMICCLILAIIIWLFVMEIDTSIQEREFKDITIEKISDAGYIVSGKLNVNVVLTGVSNELASINKEDIHAILDFSDIENNIIFDTEHEYSVTIQLPQDVGESVKSKVTNIKLTISKAK